MIEESVKCLGKHTIEGDLKLTTGIYHDYHGVTLHKDEKYREEALRIAEKFFPNTTIQVVNARLHRMGPGVQLKKHRDGSPPNKDVFHVLHLPLKTNPKAYLAFEDLEVHMEEGKVYEINYTKPHWGGNDGEEERIHLFMEIYAIR